MQTGPALAALVDRYLPPATGQCPVYLGDTEGEPFVDGVSYFAEIADMLARVKPGDAVLIAGLQVSPEMDLHGASPEAPGYRPLVDHLAELGHDGADVRVLMSGAVWTGGVSFLPFGPFRANIEAARTMRGWLPSTRATGRPPLRDTVLVDWSGALIGSNHQKVVLFRLGGELTAYLGGLDLSVNRYDQAPHDTMRLGNERWGWHDAAIRLRGRAAERVWAVYRDRWETAAALPRRYWMISTGGVGVLNPPLRPLTLPPAPPQTPRRTDNALMVLRSLNPWMIDSLRWRARRHRPHLPDDGVHEIFAVIEHAIDAAQRYVYVEDQYFKEMPGGSSRFTLYAALRRAAARGVKVILVGSGRKDPADGGDGRLKPVLTGDLRRLVVGRLPTAKQRNVVMYRIADLTVHTKIVLIDDVFACVGSANFFGRSMVGTDTELSCALVDLRGRARELRMQLWAEHLRAPMTPQLRVALEDLGLALGMWRAEWLPAGSDARTWRSTGVPAGFARTERVLIPAAYARRDL
ncbi:MAG: phospholipase D-like domain-containing protein [Nostocoides sp.]